MSSPPSSPSPVSWSPDSRLTSHLNDDANSSNATLGPLAALDAAYSGVRNIVQETYDEVGTLWDIVYRQPLTLSANRIPGYRKKLIGTGKKLMTLNVRLEVLKPSCERQRLQMGSFGDKADSSESLPFLP